MTKDDFGTNCMYTTTIHNPLMPIQKASKVHGKDQTMSNKEIDNDIVFNEEIHILKSVNKLKAQIAKGKKIYLQL